MDHISMDTNVTDAGFIDDNFHESEDTGNEEFFDDGTLESNLRQRKGKIMTCAKETIENASRLIRRRVPCAGHLMTPRRLWLNKIPTQCDVVVEFPENAPEEALRWLLGRIRTPPPDGLGLSTLVRAHDSTKRTAFYLSAPINILFMAAEEARLPKRLRTDLGGALREFTTRESHCFQQLVTSDGSTALFSSQERQWLVLQVLQGLRATPADVQVLQGRASVAEGQSIVAAWQESGLILQVFPLHETNALTKLQTSWVRKLLAPQPLDDIATYFGVKVALYFAWLGHYTCALCVPAVLGTIMWALLWGRGQTVQDIGHVIFSLFNVAWASLYLEAWRRYSVELAFRWGTLSTPPELLEPPRPLYKGPLEASPVTGRLEPREAPAWQRRAFRYLVSFPIIGLCLVLVFVVMFLMLRFQDWLDRNFTSTGIWQCMCMKTQDWWDNKLPEKGILSCLSVIPKVLLAGAITLMDEAYYKLAVWLNDKENYRLQSKYENHLIAKVALFQFVNSFLSLFYIAFYLRDQEKLKEQLAGLLISRQIIGNLRESAWPYLMEQWRLATLSFNLYGALSPTQEKKSEDFKKDDDLKSPPEVQTSTQKRSIGQAEIESSLYKYDGTFSDHLEMLVQMGYVVLFSAAFPLAGLCALANNLLEIRSDAFKLAHVHQRPFGQRVANIGTWQNALSLLSLAAVIVNCALIGLSGQVSRLWPGLTTTQTIILIVALEHIMLGLRSALTWLLPELPSWLAAEIARAEHCRREMTVKGPSPRASPPSPPSSLSNMNDQNTPDMFYKTIHMDTNTTTDDSQELEDTVFESSPTMKFDDIQKGSRSSVDADVSADLTREVTPDSPLSQTSTVLIRPLLDASPTNGQTMQNIYFDTTLQHQGACKIKLSQSGKIAEIPPFRSPLAGLNNTLEKKHFTGSEARFTTQPIQIPEIPPYRKQDFGFSSQALYQGSSRSSSISASPPFISDIPPFKEKHRKSKEAIHQLHPMPVDSDVEYHLTIGPSGGAEWARRLKVAEQSPVHKSTDCIALKELGTSSDSELLKTAPSWANVTLRPETSSTSAPSVKVPTEEEAKAAEIAAKKSRLKQKLVKSARSVAIFSLKLKERRAREAERQAQEKLEDARLALPAPPPGGELSCLPIEQLIQMEDVLYNRNNQPAGSGTT